MAKKIYEEVDISKKVLKIDIESPVFNAMLNDINKEIQRCIKKVYDEEFESGEITIKLNISIPETVKIIPKVNEFGELINETYEYRRPVFKHNITSTLKKQFKQEGIYTEEKDVKYEDGEFIVVPIKDPQMSIDDI
ncbi:hypothetical protein OR62_11120 [Clostridium tetani]|uniref:Uncharacterized protein n=1 Tax=Clostridium tetani TaxID=1513 RepID=A0ABY0ES38_CLOTA|nr:hypothetical protein [Clostridium tetani]KHO36703.1 hypothetical protein OR62_11120 [Clostridium tetani]RXI56060.1 hypothetical protein DP131_07605 [Clostridium tetani]RXI65330.1 hypothetical protein DQN76_14695 [Clostridium tetani]